MDDTTFDEEDEEEVNLCLMVDTGIEESKLEQDKKVDFDDPKSLKQAYHELLSKAHLFFQKLTKTCEKNLRNCPKIILNLKRTIKLKI